MQIQVDTDHNIDASHGFIAGLDAEIRAVLARFAEQLTRIEVHLSDESAGRSTGEDKRCVLQARPTGRSPLAVTHQATTVDEALLGAIQKLKRLLVAWMEPVLRTGTPGPRPGVPATDHRHKCCEGVLS